MHIPRKLTFRPDIQGLRAIAIAIVVFSHAGVPGFDGGFVGVDVFFVLSGFVITALLFRERWATGEIRYGSFLMRRLKRLMPALLVMVVGVNYLATILLSSYEAEMQTGSFAYSVSWTSNFYFTFVDFDYFAALRAKDLFLHTWSLAIEEQFYLVWPALISLVCAVSARGRANKSSFRRHYFLFAVIFVTSLALCNYWANIDPLLSFYMMPARGWQFALGAFGFLLVERLNLTGDGNKRGKAITTSAGIVGIALISVSTIWYHDGLNYPSLYALMPSIGAVLLLISGGMGSSSLVSRTLAARPIVWLGDRSYSLYLWHWPVLLLGGAYGLTDSAFATASLIVVSVLLAIGSYRWIELPFWKGRWSDEQPRVSSLTAVLALSLSFFSGQLVSDMRVQKTLAASDQDSERARKFFVADLSCDSWFYSAEVTPCVSGPEDASRTAVLIGDSIGTQWAAVLPEIYRAPEWRVLVLAKSSCAIADVEYFYKPAGGMYDICRIWREQSIEYLDRLQPDVIFMGSSSAYEFRESDWTRGTRDIVGKFKKIAKDVVIIPGTPALSFDGPSCLREPYRFTLRLRDSRNFCEESQKSMIADRVSDYLSMAVSDLNNVHVLDLNDLVCSNERCAARNSDGITVFRDHQHLTAPFVVSQRAAIESRLDAIGVNPNRPVGARPIASTARY
jgi:peptidoglycan/LPS O-acetylase OafA/YrhL